MLFDARRYKMQKKNFPLVGLVVLMLAALACSLPAAGNNPEAPTNEVSTIVAATLQALTPVGGETPAPAPTPVGLLPRPLYFLNNDSTGLAQVFRLETDGKTVKQVTFEPAAVGAYDVSPANGSVAYISNNQLLLVNADGSGRKLLIDGGPVDPNDMFITSLSSPVFAPDGQTLAFSNQGLVLYGISTGVVNVVLQRLTTDPITGALRPAEMYIPQSYSPDGTKILITVAIPNSDGFSPQIYTVASKVLTPLTGSDGARLCCGWQAWAADSSTLYVASVSVGMFGSGLWRMDAVSGNQTTLLPTEAGGGAYNLAAYPYLAPDGNLYYFYTTATSPDGMFVDRAPLQIVRSAADGVTGRTALRPESYPLLNEALWAPDASFVLTVTAPVQDVVLGGLVELVYTDGQQGVVQLLPYAYWLKWGR
jgi:hypothetical protein